MIIVVRPEQLKEANDWFRENLNRGGADNFDQPLIDEATGVITGYWASVNLTPEQLRQVEARFFAHDTVEATKDMGKMKSTDKKSDVPVRLGVEYKSMKPEQVLSTLKMKRKSDNDNETKPKGKIK